MPSRPQAPTDERSAGTRGDAWYSREAQEVEVELRVLEAELARLAGFRPLRVAVVFDRRGVTRRAAGGSSWLPTDQLWNLRGVGNNAVQRVAVTVA